MPIDETTVSTVAAVVAHAARTIAAVLNNDADVATAIVNAAAVRLTTEELDCAEQVIVTIAAHKQGL